MKRTLTFILLYSIFGILYSSPAAGQTTHNLQIIWQKAKPETSEQWQGWGFNMASGDLNSDGYSDFLSSIDSAINVSGDRLNCKVYIFNGGPTVSATPSQVIVYDSLGNYPTLCIDDYNGDGINDLAVGDGRGTGTNSEKGQVLVHYGTGLDLNPTPDLVIGGYGSATSTGFGHSISSGDINGDDIADLIVGADGWGELNLRGRAYIYYGDTLGLHTWPDIILNGHIEASQFEQFGWPVSSGVDFNGDGYDDILIGARGNYHNGQDAGKVYYYYGGNPMDTLPDGWVYGEDANQWLSTYNISCVHKDTTGFNPVGWFGTPDWPTTTGTWGDGKCYMVPGDTTGELMPEWTITGNEYSDSALGYWSASAGYADNDKLGDFAASALKAFADPGKVYLWLRRPTMRIQEDACIIGRGSTPGGDALGARIAPAGDVDGCGRDEFLVSNYFADTDNMIWLCKYTGPDGVAGEPVNNEQLAVNNVLQNSPNPFDHQTTIKYQIASPGMVSLKVYNIQGQLVKSLINEVPSPNSFGEGSGVRSITWDGRDAKGQRVSNGIYIYSLQTGGQCQTSKMILLK